MRAGWAGLKSCWLEGRWDHGQGERTMGGTLDRELASTGIKLMYIYSNSYCRNTVFLTVDDYTARFSVHLQIKYCIYGYTQPLCNFYSSFAVNLGYMNFT